MLFSNNDDLATIYQIDRISDRLFESHNYNKTEIKNYFMENGLTIGTLKQINYCLIHKKTKELRQVLEKYNLKPNF
jgi:hypothetical protein